MAGPRHNITRRWRSPFDSQASGCALGRDHGLELIERGLGRNRSCRPADAVGFPRWMAVIGKLGVAVGVELVANPGEACLPVVGVCAQIDALPLLGIAD